MSFASLLSQITKDKKLEEKARLSGLSNQSKASSSQAKSPAGSKASPAVAAHRTLQLGKTQPKTYFDDEDPAVRRLKEARRKEKEKLQERKAGASSSKSRSRTKSQPDSAARSRSMKPASASLLAKSAGQSSSASPPVSVATKSRFKNKPYLKSSTSPAADSGTAAPKLSFRELMKQAESIEKPVVASTPFKTAKKHIGNEPSKAYQSLQKSRSRENEYLHSSALSSRRNGSRPPASPPPRASHKLDISTGPRSRPFKASSSASSNPQRRKPALAQPNPDLLSKLKKRQSQLQSKQSGQTYPSTRRKLSGSKSQDAYGIDAGDSDGSDDYGYGNGYDDYEDDGFIVDDEEEEEEGYGDNVEYHNRIRKEKKRRMESQGYNKEEIWEIFNRGKKRNYYDRDAYDSDDMEATGTEILEDEERTLKQAKLDDLREQKLLERKAAEKKRMLHKKD